MGGFRPSPRVKQKMRTLLGAHFLLVMNFVEKHAINGFLRREK